MHTPRISLIFLLCVMCFQVKGKVTEAEYALMPELFHLDNFENCMALGEKALYCTITVQLAPINVHNKSEIWNIIQEVSDNPRNYRHDLLRHGICVPKFCPTIRVGSSKKTLNDRLSLCYISKYEHLGLKAKVVKTHCETDRPYYAIDNYDVAVAIAFGVLIFTVVFATFYEGLARYKTKEEYDKIVDSRTGRVISCFSLTINWARLRKISSATGGDAFKSLNGMRFYNTQLVIMTHVAMVTFTSPVSNPTFMENLTRKPENMIFLNGACAIQTFFVITGFLIASNIVLVFEKHKDVQIRYLVLAFINRYIRLTPCLLVMIAFNGTWLYHITRGPMWDRLVGNEYRNCRTNWWVNLLYINNYYDVENMCMQHTWYLATDTQLFLVALIVIAFMWKYQNRIKLILGVSLAIGVAIPGIINYYYDFDIVVRQYPESFYHLFLNIKQWHNMYSSSLTNFGGYSLGIISGYLYYLNSKTNTKLFTNKFYVAIWWILVWGLPLSVIYYGLLIYQDDYQYTRIGAAVYSTLQRNMFALGMCFAIYGVTEGIGWFLRDCIIWSPLQIFGRLTYCTFLVHVAVIRVRGGQQTTPVYISNYSLFTQTISDSVISHILATLLALFVELPISALQKLMVPQLANQQNSTSTQIESVGKETTNNIKKEL